MWQSQELNYYGHKDGDSGNQRLQLKDYHGDRGRALNKAEQQIKKLEKQLETASGKNKKIIQ